MRFALVRRQEDVRRSSAIASSSRSCCEQPPPLLEMERRDVALVALLGRHQRCRDAERVRHVDIGLHPLETARDGIGAGCFASHSAYADDSWRASSFSRAASAAFPAVCSATPST